MQPAAVQLTSNAVLRLRLKEIKGGCCSIWHREVLAKSVRMRWSHSSHFSVKGCLDVSTLSPNQGWNIPERGSNLMAYSWRVYEPLRTDKHSHNRSPKIATNTTWFLLRLNWQHWPSQLSTRRDSYALKADNSALTEAKPETFFYIEVLHAQMLLTKYTEALCHSDTGKARC